MLVIVLTRHNSLKSESTKSVGFKKKKVLLDILYK